MPDAIWALVAVVASLLAWDAWRRWMARDVMLVRSVLEEGIARAERKAEQAVTHANAIEAQVSTLRADVADTKRIAGNVSTAVAMGGSRKVLRR